jgi:hypothetical protein
MDMSSEDLQQPLMSESKLSDNELMVGMYLDRPVVQLILGVVIVLMLVFLAGKAGFSLWLMSKLGMGERLVNGAGEPDFWTIRRELDVYQRPDKNPQQQVQMDHNVPPATPAAAVVAAKKERFNGRREHATDPKLLAALL